MNILSTEVFYFLFNQIYVSEPNTSSIVAMCFAILLLICSGFVSASEIAFFSLSPKDKEELEEGMHKADSTIRILLDDSERLLATILISNNLVNVSIVMLLNFAFISILHFGDAIILEFIFTTVILTFLLLLFGEIIPKIYSAQNPLFFCRFAAPILSFLRVLFYPISSLLIRSKGIASHLRSDPQALTVDDLEQALELTDQKEIAQESEMLQGIIRFGGEMAREVMTPRVDIVDLDIKTTFPEVINCIVENNYSRIPIYSSSEDNIVGVLYTKDILAHIGKQNNFRWQSLIRPPYFVPETKMIDDLLRDFQANKVHIAIVVDEFGGTSGIVTMEDILEEIVGEIDDEFDEEEKLFSRLNKNTYVFEGKTLLTDFLKILGLDDDYLEEAEGDADTLAGLLLEIKGEFPSLHEKISFNNLSFEVMELDERRIVKIKVVVKR